MSYFSWDYRSPEAKVVNRYRQSLEQDGREFFEEVDSPNRTNNKKVTNHFEEPRNSLMTNDTSELNFTKDLSDVNSDNLVLQLERSEKSNATKNNSLLNEVVIISDSSSADNSPFQLPTVKRANKKMDLLNIREERSIYILDSSVEDGKSADKSNSDNNFNESKSNSAKEKLNRPLNYSDSPSSKSSGDFVADKSTESKSSEDKRSSHSSSDDIYTKMFEYSQRKLKRQSTFTIDSKNGKANKRPSPAQSDESSEEEPEDNLNVQSSDDSGSLRLQIRSKSRKNRRLDSTSSSETTTTSPERFSNHAKANVIIDETQSSVHSSALPNPYVPSNRYSSTTDESHISPSQNKVQSSNNSKETPLTVRAKGKDDYPKRDSPDFRGLKTPIKYKFVNQVTPRYNSHKDNKYVTPKTPVVKRDNKFIFCTSDSKSNVRPIDKVPSKQPPCYYTPARKESKPTAPETDFPPVHKYKTVQKLNQLDSLGIQRKTIEVPANCDLPEHKKNFIEQWISEASPGRVSSTSGSCISPSRQSALTIDSAEASLERFEMDHETPNNRDKFRLKDKYEIDKPLFDLANSLNLPKKTINEIRSSVHPKKTDKPQNSKITPIKDAKKDLELGQSKVCKDILDEIYGKEWKNKKSLEFEQSKQCKDILDEIYGKEWRNKKSLEFEQSKQCEDILDEIYGKEWRNRNSTLLKELRAGVSKTNTDKKNKYQPPSTTSSSSDDDYFLKKGKELSTKTPTTVKKVQKPIDNSKTPKQKVFGTPKTNILSTKKTVTKPKPKDSFIKDSTTESGTSSSDTGTFHTALTTPRAPSSLATGKKQPPDSVKRIQALCDSDTPDDDSDFEDNPKNPFKTPKPRKDIDTTATSEFDLGEYLPPKSSLRKPSVPTKQVTPKSTKQVLQPLPTISSSGYESKLYNVKKPVKTNSFLESLSMTTPMDVTHPDAIKFKQGNFQKTKDELVKILFKLFNEKVFDNKLPADLPIEWNSRMTGTAGFCKSKKIVKNGVESRSSTIHLANKILDRPDRVRDTLIHEMCHAGVYLINRASESHGPFWKQWAAKAMQKFPELPKVSVCHNYDIKTKYTYKCTKCGYSFGRHSKSINIERKCCGKCFGRFELLINRTTKSGTVNPTPHTAQSKKEPSAFALFVKENYSEVKKRNNNMKHGEVMKTLGAEFSKIKISTKTNKENQEVDD